MDPVKLRHFLAVFDHRNFARAAAEVGLSQPAVSKSIATLERSLGAPLFSRGRFGAEPTGFATLLAGHARLILAEGELARAEIAALANAEAGQLAIGSSVSLAQTLLPAAITRYNQRWPGVVVSVEVGLSAPMFDALLRGELDFVVSAPPKDLSVDEALVRRGLFAERDGLVVGAQHPLAAAPEPRLEDLRAFPWIIPRRAGRLEQIHKVFAAAGLAPPQQMVRSESVDLARGLLERSPYICLIGVQIFARELGAGLCRKLPDVEGLSTTRPVYVTSRRRARLRGPARNLLRIIEDLAGDPDMLHS